MHLILISCKVTERERERDVMKSPTVTATLPPTSRLFRRCHYLSLEKNEQP